jgi:8-oxo-dGTP diphosphatase
MEKKDRSPRIRVAAERILLVRHHKHGRDYYLLPGGGVMWGESMSEALSREMEEETGLKVQAGKLLCVSETIFPDSSRHIVNMVFRGIESGGELKPSSDVRVRGAEFVDLRELDRVELYPPMADFLNRAGRSGYEDGGIYLGKLWREM